MQIESVVVAALTAVLGPIRGEQARLAEDLIMEGHVDSYAIMELAAQLEQAFDITIPAERLTAEDFQSVGRLKRLCEEMIGA